MAALLHHNHRYVCFVVTSALQINLRAVYGVAAALQRVSARVLIANAYAQIGCATCTVPLCSS